MIPPPLYIGLRKNSFIQQAFKELLYGKTLFARTNDFLGPACRRLLAWQVWQLFYPDN